MAQDVVSHEVVLKRRDHLNSVLGTMSAEGETPGPEALSLFERYVTGELDLPEVRRELDKLHSKLLEHVTAA